MTLLPISSASSSINTGNANANNTNNNNEYFRSTTVRVRKYLTRRPHHNNSRKKNNNGPRRRVVENNNSTSTNNSTNNKKRYHYCQQSLKLKLKSMMQTILIFVILYVTFNFFSLVLIPCAKIYFSPMIRNSNSNSNTYTYTNRFQLTLTQPIISKNVDELLEMEECKNNKANVESRLMLGLTVDMDMDMDEDKNKKNNLKYTHTYTHTHTQKEDDRITRRIPRIIHRLWKTDNTETMPKHWNRAYKRCDQYSIPNTQCSLLHVL